MHTSTRMVVAAKGAVLWVLVAGLVGVVPSFIFPTDVTFSLPWVAAAVGAVGALAHITVSLVKPRPERLTSTVAATTALASIFSLALAYSLVGLPALLGQGAFLAEALRASVYVVLPVAAMSTLVCWLVRVPGAA